MFNKHFWAIEIVYQACYRYFSFIFNDSFQPPRPEKPPSHEVIKGNDVRDVPIKEEVEIRNKETIQFEEALKQWVNR